MRAEDQERILSELVARLADRSAAAAHRGAQRLDETLADTVYHELRRLKDEPSSRRKRADLALWSGVQQRMRGGSERVQLDLIRSAVRHYGDEIAGNFDERVYKLVTRTAVPSLALLLSAVSPKRLLQARELPRLDEQVVLDGETEHLRRLHELGTVILVPNHVSNLDSVIVGYALWQLGLPPFVYGAGLNLFSNPLLGFFMHNLGAYTVDRRKRDPLYKQCLKEYATLTLEHGYDNIFFPGGTRSRSGALERHLKLGLMGTGVSAFVHNLERGRPNPRVFIVPATLSFQLVLEAETLIDDFLKEVGKARYIITDDESAEPRRVFDFVRQLFSLDSKIHFTVGRGCDPFGNEVDDDGRSLDPHGREVDPVRYVLQGGKPVIVPQRDVEYTREVSERVVAAYARDSLIQTTHVTARAVFSLLRSNNPDVELVRLLRAGAAHDELELRAVYRETDTLLSELRSMHRRGLIRLGQGVLSASAEEVVADGLRHFTCYHRSPAVRRRGDRLAPVNRALLFYYQNRLEGYRLQGHVRLPDALSPDHRTLAATRPQTSASRGEAP